MGLIIGFLVTLVVTAIALLIISKLPLGVEIDSMGKALVSALVFGILNALAYPLNSLLSAGILKFIFSPILLLLNILVFGLAAKLVEGFRLRSIWSAVFGALLLAVLNSILFKVLGHFFPAVAS
jgi:putative membrane protein